MFDLIHDLSPQNHLCINPILYIDIFLPIRPKFIQTKVHRNRKYHINKWCN